MDEAVGEWMTFLDPVQVDAAVGIVVFVTCVFQEGREAVAAAMVD